MAMESNIQRPNGSFVARSGTKLDLNSVAIETERLTLQPVTDDYAQDMFKEFTPEVTRYMFPSSPKEISETKGFIAETTKLRSENADLVLVILSQETSEFLGVCGLHARKNPRQPEFGIWLKASAHGNGYGREAITGLYHWALETIEADFFVYPVDKDNAPSRKIPESLGGEIFAEEKKATMSGGELDIVTYKIPFRSK